MQYIEDQYLYITKINNYKYLTEQKILLNNTFTSIVSSITE